MMTSDEALIMHQMASLNNKGLGNSLAMLKSSVINTALEMLLGKSLIRNEEPTDDIGRRQLRNKQDAALLDMVGPAAASSAVEYAINYCRKKGGTDANYAKFRTIGFNGSYVHNVKLVQNDPGEYPDFTSVLRQFLLPRYAYLDFDQVIDPRHRVDAECGYPKFITPIMYRYMYDRDDMARRVVDVYPNEAWSVDPVIYENDPESEPTTVFEKAWAELCDGQNMLPMLYRLDRLCGIGHYGALLLGIDDGKDLEQPIDEPELLRGAKRSVSTKQRNLLYMRPFDEYLSFVHMYETDVSSPRYGLPKFYNLVFLDMTIDAAGASIGTRLNRRVHWSRVVHVADNLMGSLVFGIPRMQSCFNRLLDLRKIKGSSAEMFWKGAWPGLSFELDPKFVADNPEIDKKELRSEIGRYMDGLQRGIFTEGVTVKSLDTTISDNPEKYVNIQTQAIACSLEMPLRVFLGSEEAKNASEQDGERWGQRLGRRNRMFTSPSILRNVIDRFIAIGVLPPPESKQYKIDWPNLNSVTTEDKANLALKWTQALSQYVATGMIHIIQPMDYLTMILGLRPSQAKKIVDQVEENGGWDKLTAVNPDQGAGQNGKREVIASDKKSTERVKGSTT